MEKHIFCVEVCGLQVNKSCKIRYKEEKSLFLYPQDIFKIKKEIRDAKEALSSNSRESNSYSTPNVLSFKVGNTCFSYIISNFQINPYDEDRKIFNRIYKELDIFLRINSLLFELFIGISKIFIFQRQSFGYKIIRVIEQKLNMNKNLEREVYYKIGKDYQKELNKLFNAINRSELLKNIVRLLYELVAVKETWVIEMIISTLWNYLEHFCILYANHINRNLLIDQSKFKILKEKILSSISNSLESAISKPINLLEVENEIRHALEKIRIEQRIPLEKREWRSLKNEISKDVNNLIINEDILVDGYTNNKIYQLLGQKIQNFPPIKDLIKLVLREIHYYPHPTEEALIERMYMARNFLYHQSIQLEELYSKINNDFEEIKNYNFSDLKNDTKSFIRFLRKITDRVFYTSIFHSCKKVAKQISYWYHPSIERSLGRRFSNSQEFFIEKLNSIMNQYSQEKKFLNLLHLVLGMKEDYSNLFNENKKMEGFFFDMNIQNAHRFELNFKNKFEAEGTFQGGISSPTNYLFLIELKDLKNSTKRLFTSKLLFKDVIFMSRSSKIHKIYPNTLNYWNIPNRTLMIKLWLAQKRVLFKNVF